MDRVLDEMARVMASSMSRRQAFGRLWKVAVGVVAASALATPVAAQRGRTCTTDTDCPGKPGTQRCCGEQCVGSNLVCCTTTDGTTTACPAGQQCCPASGCSASQGQCNQ